MPDDALIDEAVVDDAVHLGLKASRVVGTRALTGGRGGRTWRIDMATDRFVLHRRGVANASQVSAEALATSAAAVVGVGPDVVAVDAGAGLLLTRWIPGRAASAPHLASDQLEPVVLALRRLHEVMRVEGDAIADVLPAVDPLSTRTEYLERVRLTAEVPPWAIRVLAATPAIDQLEHALRDASDVSRHVLIHGDPVPGNVIVAADGVHLVDFEYAGSGDPWYELGHLAASVHLSVRAMDRVTSVYEGSNAHAPDREKNLVEAWSYVAAQAWVAWAVLGADAGARSPRWQRWAGRATERLLVALESGRIEILAAQLRG